MIPKIIHYCWFSGEELTSQAKECIESWKKWLPDYEIKKWTLDDFDVNSVQLTKDALEAKKWAFLTDYVRHYALYNNGGIYMDSDVMLYGDISKLLDADFISACEYHPTIEDIRFNETNNILDFNGKRIGQNIKVKGIGVQAAFMASVKGHPLPLKLMNFYKSYDLKTILENKYTAPTCIAFNMEDDGYVYIDKEQCLNHKIHLYSTQVISNYDQKNRRSLAVHWCAGSWTNRNVYKKFVHKLNTIALYRIIRNTIKRIYYEVSKHYKNNSK